MVTRLGLYGGPRSPYGSFAGKVAAIVSIRGAGSGAKRKRPKHRWITIGGEQFKVSSRQEEKLLVENYVARKQEELITATAGTQDTKAKYIRISLAKARKRLDQINAKVEVERVQSIKEEDDLLIMLLQVF